MDPGLQPDFVTDAEQIATRDRIAVDQAQDFNTNEDPFEASRLEAEQNLANQQPTDTNLDVDPLTGEDDTNDQDAGTRGMIDTLPPRQVGEADMEALENNPNISRNAPCPCGSGRKYKHCHGQV